MTIDITKNYIRYRIRNPKLFISGSLRTMDIGKPGYHKMIRGVLKRSNKWATQSIIVEKDVANVSSVKKLTNELKRKARYE